MQGSVCFQRKESKPLASVSRVLAQYVHSFGLFQGMHKTGCKCKLAILALERRRQEEQEFKVLIHSEFKASLDHGKPLLHPILSLLI